MDRGAWRATVHGAAETDTAEGLTLSGSFAMKGAERVGDTEKVRVREFTIIWGLGQLICIMIEMIQI